MPDNLLYYARSGNSLRAAIAVEMAGVEVEKCFVDLARDEHKSAHHLALNPAGAVPVYVERSGGQSPLVITQSAAIAEYLLLRQKPELFPRADAQSALVRASCYAAVSDIAVQNALMRYMDFSDDNVSFLRARFLHALEAAFGKVKQQDYVCGDALTIADVFHYPVVHLRRALLSASGGFAHILAWAERMKQHDAIAAAIEHAGAELPHP